MAVCTLGPVGSSLRATSDSLHDPLSNNVGTRLDAVNVRRTYTAAGLGENWTPRELRHSFVSIMSDNGVTIEQIADLVGHRTTIVTQKVYRNSRELHQPGEKLQVSRSQDCQDGTPPALMPAS